MGIPRPFSKQSKAPLKVADNPPPVFNKHGVGEDLLKGHKHHTTPSSPSKQPLDPGAAAANANSHATSSTALWVAASNAAAKQSKGRRSSDGAPSFLEEEFYEEEILEDDYIEEEIMDESGTFLTRKITIRFDEYDEMQTTLHINDFTKHEISKVWYRREDYDKMVALARKTAEKVQERLDNLGKLDRNSQKKIEARGLEAWTAMGSSKVRMLKESAVESVWNEQSRQWDADITDWDKIREGYVAISKGAQAAAADRGFADALIAKRIRQLEQQRAEKKRSSRLLGKSKALLRATTGGVVKTAKLGVKTTKLTGKVAMGAGRAATKTAVATATLDRKMLKEAIIPQKKKKECDREITRCTSQAKLGTFDGKWVLCVYLSCDEVYYLQINSFSCIHQYLLCFLSNRCICHDRCYG